MRNRNGQKIIQIFYNMMNMGNKMNYAAKFVTNSEQICIDQVI